MSGERVHRHDREKTTEKHGDNQPEKHVGSTAVAEAQAVAARADEALDDIDKVLDELESERLSDHDFEDLMGNIDEILESNAEKFVAEYRQRGGE